jgi:predicted amidohydrolase
MPRYVTVGAAQLGPIARSDSRSDVGKRLVGHLHQAEARGCELVVFPELALTTFFPRWWITEASPRRQASRAASTSTRQVSSVTGLTRGAAGLVTAGRRRHRPGLTPRGPAGRR